MGTTRTRRADELTLPEFLRVQTSGELVAATLDEGAARILDEHNEQPVSAMARGLAAILQQAAQETRDYLKAKRLATAATNGSGHWDGA
jgi:hypothetical protein